VRILLKLSSTEFSLLLWEERCTGTEIWKPSLPPRSEPRAGEEPDCFLEFGGWDTGTRNFLRHTSKSLMQYHPKECVPISETAKCNRIWFALLTQVLSGRQAISLCLLYQSDYVRG